MEFGSKRIGGEFHIVNTWLLQLTRDVISLVNDNHVDSYNITDILVNVFSG